MSGKLRMEQVKDLESDFPIFPISAIANVLGVHQRTLRIYDELNLLKPKRTNKNRRLYSFDDIEKGKFIQYLTRDLGINLSGVKIIWELLKGLKVPPQKAHEHINKIASEVNISLEDQIETRQRLSTRGRKPSNK